MEHSIKHKPNSPKAAYGSGIVAKLSLTIFFALIFAAALISFLTYFNFYKSYAELTHQRHFVVSSNIRNAIEYSLNLGLSLNEIKNINELLDQARQKHSEITGLFVLNRQQKIIYQAVAAGDPPSQPVLLLAEKLSPTESSSTLSLSEQTYLLVPIVNNYQVKVGTLLLAYSNAYISGKMNNTIIILFRNAVVSVSIVAGIVTLIMFFMTAGFKQRLLKMNASLNGLIADSSHDADEIDETGSLEHIYLNFHEKAQELFYSFDTAQKNLASRIKDDDAV